MLLLLLLFVDVFVSNTGPSEEVGRNLKQKGITNSAVWGYEHEVDIFSRSRKEHELNWNHHSQTTATERTTTKTITTTTTVTTNNYNNNNMVAVFVTTTTVVVVDNNNNLLLL